MNLSPQDKKHLEAAQGWLELGNHIEAHAELDQITAKFRTHPAVLEVRLGIYMTAKNWEAALGIATALTKMVPDHLRSWFQASSGMFWGFFIGPIHSLGLGGPNSLKKWRSRGGWCCKGQWCACS